MARVPGGEEGADNYDFGVVCSYPKEGIDSKEGIVGEVDTIQLEGSPSVMVENKGVRGRNTFFVSHDAYMARLSRGFPKATILLMAVLHCRTRQCLRNE